MSDNKVTNKKFIEIFNSKQSDFYTEKLGECFLSYFFSNFSLRHLEFMVNLQNNIYCECLSTRNRYKLYDYDAIVPDALNGEKSIYLDFFSQNKDFYINDNIIKDLMGLVKDMNIKNRNRGLNLVLIKYFRDIDKIPYTLIEDKSRRLPKCSLNLNMIFVAEDILLESYDKSYKTLATIKRSPCDNIGLENELNISSMIEVNFDLLRELKRIDLLKLNIYHELAHLCQFIGIKCLYTKTERASKMHKHAYPTKLAYNCADIEIDEYCLEKVVEASCDLLAILSCIFESKILLYVPDCYENELMSSIAYISNLLFEGVYRYTMLMPKLHNSKNYEYVIYKIFFKAVLNYMKKQGMCRYLTRYDSILFDKLIENYDLEIIKFKKH